jgi:hypothetical protein
VGVLYRRNSAIVLSDVEVSPAYTSGLIVGLT